MIGIRDHFVRLTIAGLVLGTVGPRALANQKDYQKGLPSVAWVISFEGDGMSSGSGVLIEARRGLLLTANHVVENNPEVTIFFAVRDANGVLITKPEWYLQRIKEFGAKGRVIASDPKHDLAVIQLERVPDQAREASIARESAETAQALFSIGNSGCRDGVLWRYIPGEVRSIYDKIITYKADGPKVEAWVVETTLPSNPGDSGGPVFNDRGELVGITSGGNTVARAVSYAIDVREIRSMLEKNDLKLETPEPPVVASGPVAKLVSQSVECDVVREGRKGILAHARFEIDGAKDIPCEVMAVIYDANGRRITSKAPKFAVPGGSLATSVEIQPDRDHAVYNDFTLFLPYEAIHQSIPMGFESYDPGSGKFSIKLLCSVQIFEFKGRRWIVEKSITTTLQFDRKLGDNGTVMIVSGR